MATERAIFIITLALSSGNIVFARVVPHVVCFEGWTKSHRQSTSQDAFWSTSPTTLTGHLLQSEESTNSYPNEFNGVIKSDIKSDDDVRVIFIHGYSGYSWAQLIFSKRGDQSNVPLFLHMQLLFGYIRTSSRKNGTWQETAHVRNRFPFGDWIFKIKITTTEEWQIYDLIFEENFVIRQFSTSVLKKGDFYSLKQHSTDVRGIAWMNQASVSNFPAAMPTGGLIVISGRVLLQNASILEITLRGSQDEEIYRITIDGGGQVEVTLNQEPAITKYCSSSIVDLDSITNTTAMFTAIVERTTVGINLYYSGARVCEFGEAHFTGGDVWSVHASNFEELWGIFANHC